MENVRFEAKIVSYWQIEFEGVRYHFKTRDELVKFLLEKKPDKRFTVVEVRH